MTIDKFFLFSIRRRRLEMFKKLCAFIPNQIDNRVVIGAFEIMRKKQKLLRKNYEWHLMANKNAFKKHEANIKRSRGYIEDQNNYTDMVYGDSTMQYAGCEIFATFNAIVNLRGKNLTSLPEMIAEFEKDGMVYSGKFGTSPKAIEDFFKRRGYKTEMTTKENEFDKVGRRSGSMILTMYNDKDDITKEVHTINISKYAGKLIAHNVHCNGVVYGPYKSVSEVLKNINNGNAKGISLIGINK